jgi:hypothetical protein
MDGLDGSLYVRGKQLRLLDWGDASISHPFASLVVMFRFLEEITKLPPDDPWFARLRDAYLEPWGRGLVGAFALAIRVGTFAHSIGWAPAARPPVGGGTRRIRQGVPDRAAARSRPDARRDRYAAASLNGARHRSTAIRSHRAA